MKCLLLAVPIVPLTRRTAASSAVDLRKTAGNPRIWGFPIAAPPPQSGLPDHLQSMEDEKPHRAPSVRRSPLAGNVAGNAAKFPETFGPPSAVLRRLPPPKPPPNERARRALQNRGSPAAYRRRERRRRRSQFPGSGQRGSTFSQLQ